jgi:hypothetical protein
MPYADAELLRQVNMHMNVLTAARVILPILHAATDTVLSVRMIKPCNGYTGRNSKPCNASTF